MTNAYKVVVTVVDYNGLGEKIVLGEIEHSRHVSINIEDVQVVDVGEWHDDHPLNKIGCDTLAWFNGQ